MSGDGRRQPAGASAAPAARAEPWGVFSLTHGAAPRAEALARPYVRGASVRAYWRDFEPQEGRFDWALFDETLARAQRHGKKAAFRVMNGTGTPEWVYAAGAQAYDPQDRGVTRLPLPWDDVFFEKWRAFIGALARRYDGHPGVAYVAMSMPAGRWAELLFPVSLPHLPGYSMERFVDSHRRVLDAYGAAFPHTPLTLAVTGHEYDGSLQRVVAALTEHLVARFGPDNPRVLIQANGWSERTVMGRNTTVDRTFDACFARPLRRGLQQIAGAGVGAAPAAGHAPGGPAPGQRRPAALPGAARRGLRGRRRRRARAARPRAAGGPARPPRLARWRGAPPRRRDRAGGLHHRPERSGGRPARRGAAGASLHPHRVRPLRRLRRPHAGPAGRVPLLGAGALRPAAGASSPSPAPPACATPQTAPCRSPSARTGPPRAAP